MKAGFGKVEIPVPDGTELVGYPLREGPSTGRHEPLYARSLVLDTAGERVAFVSVDLLHVLEPLVSAARALVGDRALLPGENLFVSATHTHSGPDPEDPELPVAVDQLIAAAVEQAVAALQPASVGAGWGILSGKSFNRRRLEDPVDPAVFVLRVERPDGRPLGLCYGIGCHPVIMGFDSNRVSADWPGVSSRIIESELGDDAVALFVQGAGGDVNPLTPELRAHLEDGCLLETTTQLRYHGPSEEAFPIAESICGDAAEADPFGQAVADEVLRVHRGVETVEGGGVWTRCLYFEARADGEPSGTPNDEGFTEWWEKTFTQYMRADPIEVMLVVIESADVVIVGQPGEVFGITGITFRQALREIGVSHPFLVGLANGGRAYLPPRVAYADAGYEVSSAWTLNLPEDLQDRVLTEVVNALTPAA